MLAALGGLFVAGMEFVSQVDGRMGWINMLGFSWVFFFGPTAWLDRPLYVVSHGVLAVARAVGLQARIPLHACDIKRDKHWWRFRWPEGRRRETVAVPAYPLLLTLIGEGLAESLDGPRTRREAERLVSAASIVRPAQYAAVVLIGFFAALGLSVWLNQPLFLLPLAIGPLFAPFWNTLGYVILTPDGLHVAVPDLAPVLIPRADVTEVASRGRDQGLIFTSHPDFPKLTVNRFAATDLLRRLEHGAADPAPSPTVPKVAPPGEVTLHCALCGRIIEPGLVARQGEVHICERCASRARQEAVDSGHGPAGRDPKPM